LRISPLVFPKKSASESYNSFFLKALDWIFDLVETPKTVSLSCGRLVNNNECLIVHRVIIYIGLTSCVNSKCKLQAIFEIWLLYIFTFAQKTAMLFCWWPLTNIWMVHYVKTDDILQKQVFFILQWLFLSITLRSGKYHKVLFVKTFYSKLNNCLLCQGC
jgi:hypothetical protein